MARKEQWITGKEATAILRRNSGRDDIPDSYIRTLARGGKVETKALDGRTNLYKLSDVDDYVVRRREQGKGRGKSTGQQQKEETVA